ncbi:rhomboid family intramembrane serine protease [Thermodesulfobacteriota bacterium]
MRYQTPYGPGSISFGGPLTPVVKKLLIACTACFLVQTLGQQFIGLNITRIFGLTPSDVFPKFRLWQLVTYIFLHGNLFHLLFNMLALFMFGCELERIWGGRLFTKYFFITGVGAGICSVIVDPTSEIATIGASGAIYGILLAYGMIFPNRQVYLYFLFPIRVKYFVIIIGAIAFYSAILNADGGVAHVAHLGGMIFGFILLRHGRLKSDLEARYLRWKLDRMKRKFKVISRDDDDEDKGPTIH